MTKKHFIALAERIKHHNEEFPNHRFDYIQQQQLASFCQEQNPNFNRERWLDYIAGKCGPNGGMHKDEPCELTADLETE